MPTLSFPNLYFATSPLAHVSQQPSTFEYPRKQLPWNFHFCGPFRSACVPSAADFPYHLLDGRPLVYASLGTLQNKKLHVFQTIAAACSSLPVQLVITHGGALDSEALRAFEGNPIAVDYAPQTELIARASVVITHGGLNTVLDALTHAVPMVVLPITFEQPAIATRVEWCGAGLSIPKNALTAPTLRATVERILHEARFQKAAQRMKESIARHDGCETAATIIVTTLLSNQRAC
ncbi:MAG: glycosyltransferase [Casimicrobium sp.]